MNLFLVALSSGPAPGAKVTQAVRATAERVPYLSGNKCHEHVSSDRRLAAAWIAHRPEQVGGVRYWITRDDQLALFCGRPILRTDTGFDGRRPLSPELYLTPTQDWEDYLDGRFTVVHCSGHHVSVVTDPLGADRVFTAEGDGVRWIGNNADTIALASNARGVDTLALASLLTFGWSFGGRPLHAGIERLRPNATHVFDTSANGRVRWDCRRRSGSWSSGDAQFDPARAADILAGVTQAMMDWPQRPVTVSVTGGRDSRLTFAAALGGRRSFAAATMAHPHDTSFPDTGDVSTARTLCAIAQVPHHTTLADPGDALGSARLAALLTANSVSAGVIGTLPAGLPLDPLEIHVTGQGGELGRLFYGSGFASSVAAAQAICQRHQHRIPPPIAGTAAIELVSDWVRVWAQESVEEGAQPGTLGDRFYLEERMGAWAATGHGAYGYWADTVCPFWTAALLPSMFACPAEFRARDGFHNLVLARLAPELWAVPFAGHKAGWPPLGGPAPAAGSRLRMRARQVEAELARRWERVRRRSNAGDSIQAAQARARELADAEPQHPAWDLLHRGRVRSILTCNPANLHPRSRELIWRLLTAFERSDLVASRADTDGRQPRAAHISADPGPLRTLRRDARDCDRRRPVG